MKSFLASNYIIILAICAIFVASCKPSISEEKKAVAKSWSEYRDALFYQKGKEAWQRLSKSTTNYYSELLNYVKVADSTQLDSFNFLTKLCVLCTRRLLTKKEINQLNPEKLFLFYISSGLLGDENVVHTKASYIKVRGSTANAMLTDSAGRIMCPIDFAREDGEWKVDFVRMFVQTSQKMSKLLKEESGKSENELIKSTLESVNGPTTLADVWHPLKD